MTKKYYVVGLRPVYSEYSDSGEHINTLSFNWETGNFEQDWTYYTRIILGKVDELEILNEEDFNLLVAGIRKKRNH